jgi:hypothetical protein
MTSHPDLSSYHAGSSARSDVAATTHAVHAVTVLSLDGSGTKSTKRFPVTSDWDLKWSYNCSGFSDGTGNFVIVPKAGATFSQDNLVNQLGASGDSTEHYHNGTGERYLEVNSECNWTVEVVDYE